MLARQGLEAWGTCSLTFSRDSTLSYLGDRHRALRGFGQLWSGPFSCSWHRFWISRIRLTFSFSWSFKSFSGDQGDTARPAPGAQRPEL